MRKGLLGLGVVLALSVLAGCQPATGGMAIGVGGELRPGGAF